MVKILIADDNHLKIKDLREVLSHIPEISFENYDIATDLISAKRYLSVSHYDLLILDLNIPERAGDDPLPENGINFLEEIKRSQRLLKPFHIIGLTAYEKYKSQFESVFIDDLWGLIHYDPTNRGWEKQIKLKINYLLQSKRDLQSPFKKGYEFDLAIITALRITELESVLTLPANWESFTLNDDATEYHKGIFEKNGKKISVIAAAAPQMGMVAASVLTMKIIHSFRPKYIAMTGIAGGIKGIGNFGDILASDISFDSGSGKIRTDSEGNKTFEPDYRSIELDTDLREALTSCKGKREFLDDIKRDWPADKPDTDLQIHIGPFASGAGVIENKQVIDEIRGHSRKLVGIDMETYGVFYACKHCSKPRPISAFSFKSISDFADPEKNDSYQKFAAFTSTRFLYNFVMGKVNFNLF